MQNAECIKCSTLECLKHDKCDFCEHLKAIIDKLAHYEDLEEQGRLVEVVHGKWIEAPELGDCCYKCSKCGKVFDAYREDDKAFCARCGAKMDKGE